MVFLLALFQNRLLGVVQVDHHSLQNSTRMVLILEYQFRKYVYRLRYDSVIDPKVIQQWKCCMKLYVLQLRN